jgi:UDP-N-acetylmuramate: L-alanyl-gamma-D-glutamyl-meso-diaminopimelate ligase
MNFGVSARLGQGPCFVIEADEYDTAFFDKRSKFVHYRPRTAILNNLEFDHADIFDNLAAIERQFHHLVRTVPATGRLVVNGAQTSLSRVLALGCWSEVARFGAHDTQVELMPGASTDAVLPSQSLAWRALGDPSDFDVWHLDQCVAHVRWSLTGVHNQLNAVAAIAAAHHIGITPEQSAQALTHFENVRRRMEVRGVIHRSEGDITVYDDFAHHPTAIRTTLNGLRRKLGQHARILAVFEPRSNTMKLGTMKSQLPWSLHDADLAFCHSGGLDWDAHDALQTMGTRAQVASSIEQVLSQVVHAARAGDHIVCMSNGGFGGIHTKLIDALTSH